MALAGDYRIKSGARIKEVKEKGKLFQSESFGVSVLGRGDAEVPKFAFIISSKISNLAVHRNRVNRSLNEGVRQSLNRIPRGYDFVFLAKKTIEVKKTEDIIKEVENFFSNLKL